VKAAPTVVRANIALKTNRTANGIGGVAGSGSSGISIIVGSNDTLGAIDIVGMEETVGEFDIVGLNDTVGWDDTVGSLV